MRGLEPPLWRISVDHCSKLSTSMESGPFDGAAERVVTAAREERVVSAPREDRNVPGFKDLVAEAFCMGKLATGMARSGGTLLSAIAVAACFARTTNGAQTKIRARSDWQATDQPSSKKSRYASLHTTGGRNPIASTYMHRLYLV
jgi:hypothetical protein